MTDTNSRTPDKRKAKLVGGAFVVLLALYGLFKPALERQFGIDLPDQPRQATPFDESRSVADQNSADTQNGEKAVGDRLRDVGGNVLVSTAGLRYVPGSREGHRLDHVLRHDNDIPDRPGKHGVFDGGRDDLLRVLDEAWVLVKTNDKAVETQHGDGRAVHDVDMGRRVGFVGGQVGNERDKPAARHIRLIVEGDNVISAYPY